MLFRSLGFVSGGEPFGLEVNAHDHPDAVTMERAFLRLFSSQLQEHRPDL